MLISMLGINNHGVRVIAKVQTDKNAKSKEFLGIYIIQFTLTIIMILIYFILIVFFNNNYKVIMIIQGIYLLSVFFDVNWFFFGLEKFRITISRNIIIKLLSVILIFLLIKNDNDLWKYCFIMSISTLISQIYLWIFLKKEINFIKITKKDIIKNIKPCIILFIPVISYSIYRIMDKMLIGLIAGTYELGYYESAEKVLNIPISIYTALGTVTLPYMSKSNKDNFEEKIKFSFSLCFFSILPILFGLFTISDDFTIAFFGENYFKSSTIIKILIPSIVFSSIASIIKTNYLIPKKIDNIYVKSTLYGAIINLAMNLILIPKYGSCGAAFGTIAAEFSVMIYQLIKVWGTINAKIFIKPLVNFSIKSLIMCFIILLIGKFTQNSVLKLVIQILIGCIVYFIMCYKYIVYNLFEKRKKIREVLTK